MSETTHPFDPSLVPPAGNRLYQAFDIAEGSARASAHYEQSPAFFDILTAGGWNTYSASLCEPGLSMLAAQERKLDLMAERMQLKSGMHILDVGCGWGGPLVYLCRKYGVTGVGIAVTQQQIAAARARAAAHSVDAQFEVVHWQNLAGVETFDAIYTDEVMVHFPDLGAFFAHCRTLLKPGQLMVHKELHLAHSSFSQLGRMSEYVNAIYAYTGNYITLHQELKALDDSGFALRHVEELPLEHYRQTLDLWLKSMFEQRERMKALEGPETYQRFRAYLKAMRYLFSRTSIFGLHIVTSRKLD